MWRHPRALPEPSLEVTHANACQTREFVQRYSTPEVLLYIVFYCSEAVNWQSTKISSGPHGQCRVSFDHMVSEELARAFGIQGGCTAGSQA